METAHNTSRRFSKIELLAWVCVVLGVALTAVAFYFEETHPWGDTVGGIAGPMFALAGVLLFYSALRLQREDLGMQRAELSLQRQELKETTKALKAQRREMERTRKAEVLLRLAFKLEESRVARVTVTPLLRLYYLNAQTDYVNSAWHLDMLPDPKGGGLVHPPDKIARWMNAWPRSSDEMRADADAIEEMLSLLEVCRIAWCENLVEHDALAAVLKPEVSVLKDIYNRAKNLTSFTLDRYRLGHKWLVEVAKEASVTDST